VRESLEFINEGKRYLLTPIDLEESGSNYEIGRYRESSSGLGERTADELLRRFGRSSPVAESWPASTAFSSSLSRWKRRDSCAAACSAPAP
jgi:hypothetical protein